MNNDEHFEESQKSPVMDESQKYLVADMSRKSATKSDLRQSLTISESKVSLNKDLFRNSSANEKSEIFFGRNESKILGELVNKSNSSQDLKNRLLNRRSEKEPATDGGGVVQGNFVLILFD